MVDLFLKNIWIISPLDGLNDRYHLWIQDGIIAYIGREQPSQIADATPKEIDASRWVAVPGLFDMHVHFREPGATYKEDTLSGIAAAANGGFTGVLCMPNTQPPLDNPQQIQALQMKGDGKIVDVFYSGTITKGRAGQELTAFPDLLDIGVLCFTDDGSSVPTAAVLHRAFRALQPYDGLIAEHCEDTSLTQGFDINEGVVSARLGLKGYPAVAEELIIARDILLAEATGNPRLHICHLSTKGGVALVRQAKDKGLRVTAEVTPHHLSLTEAAVEHFQTNAKMSPPLRTDADVEALVQGLEEGVIDCIATDHAPHAWWEKEVVFAEAPYGIVGLETAVGIVLTFLHHRHKVPLKKIVEWMAINPRKILQLPQPRFQVGAKANCTILAPQETWTVDAHRFQSKSRNTPYHGMQLRGKPVMVINNGLVTESQL